MDMYIYHISKYFDRIHLGTFPFLAFESIIVVSAKGLDWEEFIPSNSSAFAFLPFQRCKSLASSHHDIDGVSQSIKLHQNCSMC
jgi:hypothetical protein